MGVGPIPYSAMRAYAAEYNIRGRDDFDYFITIIQALDNRFLSYVNSTDKKSEMVPITDVEEQHRLFARLAERAKDSTKKPAK